ncbi:MAG: ATP/GTP-binding protein, partial [Flavobacterium sp.]|nr:ATP/GTP-binding protein [Pedobacter sp.]
MKNLFKAVAFFGLLLSASVSNAQNQLVKLWETDSVFKVPESVLYHSKSKTLYVSNIDGEPGKKDQKGSISKMSADGKVIDNKWVTDISAPTGMCIFENTLYAADVNEVVAIDLKTGKVKQKFPVKDAGFLNDITINKKGIIYVSDSRTGIIHQIDNGVVSVFLEKQDGINGLLSIDDDLYILLKGSLW